MRAQEFLVERWTARTVRDYFDSKENNRVSRGDFTVSRPFDQCIMFRFKTVPDLTRAFFRMAEYYEGNRYAGSTAQDIDMADFLDNFVDRSGSVDYFKFWDGFNITDQSFESWLKGVGKLGQAEQLVVNTVKKSLKRGPYAIIGVAGNTTGTDDHELFHAMYYLRPAYRRSVNKLMKASEFVFEKWSEKYKSSINCSHPRGFSQKAHCAGKRKQNESVEMEMVCEVCGMCEAHANTHVNENLRDWFKDKWVRFGPDGKIRGDCARGSESEGKPKCLPQAKAHALGKKGRASAAARKRRKDPNANRSGPAINVSTKGTKK